jgi:hypothetical protein
MKTIEDQAMVYVEKQLILEEMGSAVVPRRDYYGDDSNSEWGYKNKYGLYPLDVKVGKKTVYIDAKRAAWARYNGELPKYPVRMKDPKRGLYPDNLYLEYPKWHLNQKYVGNKAGACDTYWYDLAIEMFKYKDGILYGPSGKPVGAQNANSWGNLATSITYVREKRGSYRGRVRDRRGHGNKPLLVHNIVFFMHYGFLPPSVVHFDRDPMNNKIENLVAKSCGLLVEGTKNGPKPDGWGRVSEKPTREDLIQRAKDVRLQQGAN